MAPPVSLEAFQLTWTDDEEVAVAVTLAGVEGLAVMLLGVYVWMSKD